MLAFSIAFELLKAERLIIELAFPYGSPEMTGADWSGDDRHGTDPLYLPGNGALLAAVGMMAAGWDGCGTLDAPGFPGGGEWKVSHEGLRPMP